MSDNKKMKWKYTKDDIIRALRKNPDRTCDGWAKEGMYPCVGTIIKLFGSWNEARRAAGLEIRRSGGQWNTADLEPSPFLSYVIGVYYSDGYAAKVRRPRSYNYIVGLKATDRGFVRKFRDALIEVTGQKYKIQRRKLENMSDTYRVEAMNKHLYFFLKEADRHKKVIEAYPAEFLKGVFDGDGGIYDSKTVSFIQLVNTDPELIRLARNLLIKHFHIRTTVRWQEQEGKKDVYILKISRNADIKIFRKKIGFSIRRKQEKLKRLRLGMSYKDWNEEKVLKELGSLARKLGRSPRARDASRALVAAAYRYYGSWNTAKDTVGLKTYGPRGKVVGRVELH